MNKHRIEEIKAFLTDDKEIISNLCNASEESYKKLFQGMKLMKLLFNQKVPGEEEIQTINLIRQIFEKDGIHCIALNSYIYGKIQGKREERARRKRG